MSLATMAGEKCRLRETPRIGHQLPDTTGFFRQWEECFREPSRIRE
jgi:hypothetical protein